MTPRPGKVEVPIAGEVVSRRRTDRRAKVELEDEVSGDLRTVVRFDGASKLNWLCKALPRVKRRKLQPAAFLDIVSSQRFAGNLDDIMPWGSQMVSMLRREIDDFQPQQVYQIRHSDLWKRFADSDDEARTSGALGVTPQASAEKTGVEVKAAKKAKERAASSSSSSSSSSSHTRSNATSSSSRSIRSSSSSSSVNSSGKPAQSMATDTVQVRSSVKQQRLGATEGKRARSAAKEDREEISTDGAPKKASKKAKAKDRHKNDARGKNMHRCKVKEHGQRGGEEHLNGDAQLGVPHGGGKSKEGNQGGSLKPGKQGLAKDDTDNGPEGRRQVIGEQCDVPRKHGDRKSKHVHSKD
mmetsp:Transcript_97421/g.225857  ORF Transcript_97421/g.225857 Transcript_97421/m.225857 type:complete len:354 (-) Transcript_97421:125-1186(-)